MGRKDKNRISKNIEEPIIDDEDIEETQETLLLHEEDCDYNLTGQMLNIYETMMNYRENQALPILEYMTSDVFLEFTDYISNNE